MKVQQGKRLSKQQLEGKGAVGFFGKDARALDFSVGEITTAVFRRLTEEFPGLNLRWRSTLTKREINEKLQSIDEYLGQELFVSGAEIRPDGGIIEVKDDLGNWRVILVTEAKYQGRDIENIRQGIMVGKKHNQDIMAAGNAIERSHKNIKELANFMLGERHFPYVLFLAGSNFLTQSIVVTRPDGRKVELQFDSSQLNRIDRLTAANYSMPINTNLCENRLVTSNGHSIMLQAASIYTQGAGGEWSGEEMARVMYEVATTSLKVLASDLFKQLSGGVAEDNLK